MAPKKALPPVTHRISARPTCHAAMSTESPGRSIRAAAGDLCGDRRGVPQALGGLKATTDLFGSWITWICII